MCDDESCSHSAGLSAVTANADDVAGNPATEADVNAWYDAVAPTTTISSVDISADTGSSDSDFITKTAAQTVTATLSAARVAGETHRSRSMEARTGLTTTTRYRRRHSLFTAGNPKWIEQPTNQDYRYSRKRWISILN